MMSKWKLRVLKWLEKILEPKLASDEQLQNQVRYNPWFHGLKR